MKTVVVYFLTFVSVLICGYIHAQKTIKDIQRCGTDEYMEQKMQDPVFKAAFLEQEMAIDQQMERTQAAPCAAPLIIPIAVHYNTPITDANPQCLIDKALEQVAQLNLDYSFCNANVGDLCDFAEACPQYFDVPIEDLMPEDGACIQFCLGDQNLPTGEDNIGGYAITVGDYVWTGQNTDTQNNWDGFLNIFVNSLLGDGDVLGVAPFNGGANPSGNGVYIVSGAFGGSGGPCGSGASLDNLGPYTIGATATHEIGHYFGLSHTFSDNLADTPPQTVFNIGCPSYNTTTCSTSAGSDFSGNFMDYVNDACMSNFSASQVTRMQLVAANQNVWAIDKISCFADWFDGTNTYMSCQSFCEPVACPTEASTGYFTTDQTCAGTTYTLPTDYAAGGLVLDEDLSATYTWSIGGYLPTGTALSSTYTPDPIVGCGTETLLLFLNVGCTGDADLQINGGALSLTIYSDPTQFTIDDLVTFVDGDCQGPTWEVTPECASFVTVTQTNGPTFPVTSGSGTADYEIILSYPADCCTDMICDFTTTVNYECDTSGNNCEADNGDW